MGHTEWNPEVLPIFLVVFPLMWLGVVGALSLASGWRELAEVYPAPRGSRPHWSGWPGGARMRGGVSYSSCLRFAAEPHGFFVRPIWCFAPFHPTMLIPWSDLEVAEERLFWSKLGTVTCTRFKWARFLVGRKVMGQIHALRGAA